MSWDKETPVFVASTFIVGCHKVTCIGTKWIFYLGGAFMGLVHCLEQECILRVEL
jgi:hypothetical protein